MGSTQLYGQNPSCLGWDRLKINRAKVDQKDLGQHQPKIWVGPMSAQQNFFSIYGTGPNLALPFLSGLKLVQPSKQWRDSPMFCKWIVESEL
jgi:hypothetical protein